jgi:predicted DNA-binding WGR domain protein
MIHPTHIDPPQNMARFYGMDIQTDLTDGWRLITDWGHIGRGGTLRTAFFPIHRQAAAALVHKVCSKLRLGYAPGGRHGP